MKSNIFRWVIAALLLCAMTMLVVSPVSAEVTPLPLDQLAPGNPLQESGWSSVKAKEACDGKMVIKYASKTRTWTESDTEMKVNGRAWERYEDESISMEVTYFTARPAYKPTNLECSAVHVKIADPSQIRTAMSYDDYNKREYVKASDMARHVNAVAAVNGDFFKYHYNVGYVLRQGVFYRDSLNGERDALIIDNKGNFHTILAAESADMAARIAELESQGLQAINTFTLGPVLAENGEARLIKESATAKASDFQWRYPQQRVAICQLGELEYVIVEAYGKTDSSAGMTLQEFADMIVYLYPDVQVAYNLDGGGSTNVIVGGERIHKTPGARKISDIIYFASAYTEGGNTAENE